MTIAADQACPQPDAPTQQRPVETKDRVYAVLVARADDEGAADVTIDEIRAEVGAHRRTVQRALRRLVADGRIHEPVWHRWPGRPCTYRLATR